RNRRPDLAGKITRIDVCGRERDSTANIFFFHMNLLRGDSDAHKQLAEKDISFIVEYDRWRGLYNDGQAHSSVALPELGLTFHAGEDFYHPLDGIFQIDSAIEGLHMRAGDSLGHALALGWDLERHDDSRGKATHIPRGLQFDSLIWLHKTLIESKAPCCAPITKIELWLGKECQHFYGKIISIDILHQLIIRQYGPLVSPQHCAHKQDHENQCDVLWYQQLYDSKVIAKRDCNTAIHNIVHDLRTEIGIAQTHVFRKIIERGIVVEANPSSNLRVGGLPDERDLPLAVMINQAHDDLRITINTDNPGVFGIRIENEYAIAWQALMTTAKLNRPQVLARLDKARKCGLELPISRKRRLIS
ncbi:MAG: hypothetical protein WCK65_15385, partial [Rhodospirillaceae bacterium]